MRMWQLRKRSWNWVMNRNVAMARVWMRRARVGSEGLKSTGWVIHSAWVMRVDRNWGWMRNWLNHR